MSANTTNSIFKSSSLYSIKTMFVESLFRAYSTLFFCYSPWVGAWFAILSVFSPRTAFAGFFSLLCTWVWGKILRFNPPGDLHLVNGLLCGLFLSAYYPISVELLVSLIIVTLLVTLCVNWLAGVLWKIGKIPLMTLPFVLATWPLLLIFHEVQMISLPSLAFIQGNLPEFLSYSWTNSFFSSIGGLVLVPYPLPGALIFLGLIAASRYLTFLTISGYIVGASLLYFYNYNFLIVDTGFNLFLPAIALGGIFLIPSVTSFFIALCGSALAAFSVMALHKLLSPLELPQLVLPFLVSVYIMLGALGNRVDRKTNILNLDFPISPEISWERYRLECARGIHINSTFISQPFTGEWKVDFDKEVEQIYFSHKKTVNTSGEANNEQLEHNIVAPVNAVVIEIRDIGSSHHKHAAADQKWGNYILLRDYFGCYIMLPFLKDGSIKVSPDDSVTIGQPIAACSEIYNDEYRFYIQVHRGVRLGSRSLNFHLANVLTYRDKQPKEFKLFYQPVVGDSFTGAKSNDEFNEAIDLQPGLNFNYNVSWNSKTKRVMSLQTGVTPQGQNRLYAAKDRSIAYEKTSLYMVFFDMQGHDEPLLNLWALALGLTPATTEVDFWIDKPSLKTWPLSKGRRLFVNLVRVLGVPCTSRYTRTWDEKTNSWIQKGEHQAKVLPGMNWKATTIAVIDKTGVRKISIDLFNTKLEAELIN